MKYNTEFINGDIIASINAGNCTGKELLKRFDNYENTLLQWIVFRKIDELVGKGMLKEDKNGTLRCTRKGKKYIVERGYLA